MTDDTLSELFEKEVLSAGPAACLPANLEQKWLDVLVEQSDNASSESGDARMTELVTAVIRLLAHRQGRPNDEVRVTENDAIEHIDQYCFELLMEKACREIGMTPEPATLDTIFTPERNTIAIPHARP